MTAIPSIDAARRLVFEVKQLSGAAPAVLTNLLDLVETVKTAPAAPDPVRGLVDAAADGKASTAAELQTLVADAAKAEAEAEYFKRLQAGIARDAMKRFAAELAAGAADDIIDSLRPVFEDIAQQIVAAKSVVDFEWTTERLVADGDLEQLSAYRLLPDLVARADRIATLVTAFGPHGHLSIIDEPGSSVEMRGLRGEALWVTADLDPWRASEIIRARMADWKTSPSLRLPLTLNSVATARERLREFAEAEWAALENSRGVRGRMTDDGWKQDPKRPNPFALPDTDAPAAIPAVETPAEDADVVDFEKIVG